MQETEQKSELMTEGEVATRLGISYQEAHRAIARGEIPWTRVCGARRVPRQAFEAWLQEVISEAVARQTMKILDAISAN
jgi:excisionase family DNA binding protein